MKKISLFTIGLMLTTTVFAQKEVNKTVTAIPDAFKKATIASVELTDNNNLEIILSQEKKKETQLYQFTFDQNVNKTNEMNVQFDSSPNSDYGTVSKKMSKKDALIRFVRVSPSSFWGEMELEKGYIQKNYTDGKYVGTQFITEEKISKIRTEDDRKIMPISEMHVGLNNETQSTRTFGMSENYGFLSAGDLIAVGGVFPKLVTKGRLGVGSTDTHIDYCVVKADAKNLTINNISLVPFKYVQQTELCREVTVGKKILLITKDFPFCPKGSEEFYNKGSQTRTATVINQEGSVDSQVTFEGFEDMTIIGADMLENGNIYILARAGKKKDLAMVAIKIENGSVTYNQNNLMAKTADIAVKPSTEKKAKMFNDSFPYLTKKTTTFRGIFELDNKNMVAVFQDQGAEGFLFYLQFNEKGNLIKHYSHGMIEKQTASSDGKTMRPIDFFIRQNNNSGFYSVIIEKNGDGSYFRICKIDGNAGTMSDFTSYGRKTKKDKYEYYLDRRHPGIDTPDSGFIMIGRTSDNKNICVEKVIFE